LLPDIEALPLKGRVVTLYPDSDVWRRRDLLDAVYRLGRALAAQGAAIRVCALPAAPGETKQGLDDYLVMHSAAELATLPHIPLSHKRFDRVAQRLKARENFGKPPAHPAL
jgi:hypothetical protein